MILTVYVVTALLATAAFIIVGYGINNGMAAASITTQQQSSMVSEQRSSDSDSTVIQQSSGQSQSSSTSSSVITSESSSGEGTSSSNRIVTSTGNDNLQIDRQSSGKIASSRLNLTNGEVEAVLFGDWSLNGTSGFVDNFIYKPSNGTAPIEYKMSGLELHSINQINDNLVLAGTIDVASNSTAVLQDTPVTIMIQNGILAVGFGNTTQATDLFGGIPILGFEQ
jgi:cytoskeletal protein RodZ